MSFLYDQFNALYKELGKCIGDGGEFSGNFEQFRRRHQAISRSVQEADRFLMISNVAAFCCQIVMCNQERSNYPRLFTRTNAVYIQAPAQDAPVPALDSAGCSCGCRVPSSHRRCCDCTASSAPTTNVQTRLDSVQFVYNFQLSSPCGRRRLSSARRNSISYRIVAFSSSAAIVNKQWRRHGVDWGGHETVARGPS